jgi:hypothetical protein
MGYGQTKGKERMHKQTEAKRIRNQCRPAKTVHGDTEHLQRV